jgi:tRNA dimethylallyltransferase
VVRQQLKERMAAEGGAKLHQELMRIDHISAEKIHSNDTHRLLRALEVFYSTGKPWSEHLQEHQAAKGSEVRFDRIFQIGLTTDREILYRKINRRCEMMVESGLEEEVRGLLDRGYTANLKSMGAIGYKHMLEYIAGTWSKNQMNELLARDTRRYAKRQYTWFSATKELTWFDVDTPDRVREEVASWLTGN